MPLKRGYVTANGVNYYYEIHGKGEPLLLLHGGLGSIDIFEPGLSAFSRNREVIAAGLYGHGRTALTDRSISGLLSRDAATAGDGQLGDVRSDEGDADVSLVQGVAPKPEDFPKLLDKMGAYGRVNVLMTPVGLAASTVLLEDECSSERAPTSSCDRWRLVAREVCAIAV